MFLLRVLNVKCAVLITVLKFRISPNKISRLKHKVCAASLQTRWQSKSFNHFSRLPLCLMKHLLLSILDNTRKGPDAESSRKNYPLYGTLAKMLKVAQLLMDVAM